MRVHSHSGACGGNVTVPTLVHLCVAPHTYVDGLLNESTDIRQVSRSRCSGLLICFLFFSFEFGGCWSRGGGCCCLDLPKQLGQLPCPHLFTCCFKGCPSLSHQLVTSINCANSWNYKWVNVSLTSPTCMLFNALHLYTISPMSPIWITCITLYIIHTSHDLPMLIFGIVVNLRHFHVLLLLLHLLITNHLQAYLLPQLEPCFVFIWIVLLKLQYMYFSIYNMPCL